MAKQRLSNAQKLIKKAQDAAVKSASSIKEKLLAEIENQVLVQQNFAPRLKVTWVREALANAQAGDLTPTVKTTIFQILNREGWKVMEIIAGDNPGGEHDEWVLSIMDTTDTRPSEA